MADSNSLATALKHHGDGRLKQAEQIYQQILRQDPHNADALHLMGVMAYQSGKHEIAFDYISRALQVRPDVPHFLGNLGLVHQALGRFDDAIATYRRALELNPSFATAHSNLGTALKERGRLEEAVASYGRAIAAQPDYVEAHYNLGNALREQEKFEDAIASYDRALAIKPDHSGARLNRARLWLRAGDYQRGWLEYEWRWKCNHFRERDFPEARWDGSPLEGRTILLGSEQGLGDTFQFVRYANVIKRQNAKVMVGCPKSVVPILSTNRAIDQLVPWDEPLPPFDVYAPMLSLPHLVPTTLETVPTEIPYLSADEALVQKWRKTLDGTDGFKIGIAWRGNPKNIWDHGRSFPLAELAPLAEVAGVQLISLQKQHGMDELAELGKQLSILDLGSDFDQEAGTFMDTAAVLQCLDLVICCDTAVGHLAGAMGIPVWLALYTSADWRWLSNRPDSPWYPRHRLFWQPRRDDWAELFRQMKLALEEEVARRSSGKQ